jgi:hypothetical protein
MAEGTEVDPRVLDEALGELITNAMVLRTLIREDSVFYVMPSVVSQMDMDLMAVKSGFSVMVMTCIAAGVDFIAQDTKEVPDNRDRSTGEDPLDGGGLPDREVHGESTEA